MTKVLITGSYGFIGSQLYRHLREIEDVKTIIDLEKFVTTYDIQSAPRSQFEYTDIVYHLAARQPSVMELNEDPLASTGDLVDTEILLNKMRLNDVKKIVFTSSSTVYGQPYESDMPIKVSQKLNPISVYGATKAAQEMLIRGFCNTYGMQYCILRLANVVGPTARRGVVYDIVEKLCAHKEKLRIIGTGRQTKSYLYIDDCVKAIASAGLNKYFTEATYNLASFDTISVYEVVEIICNVMQVNPIRTHVNDWQGDVQYLKMDMMGSWHVFQDRHTHCTMEVLPSADAVKRTATEMLKNKGLIAA